MKINFEQIVIVVRVKKIGRANKTVIISEDIPVRNAINTTINIDNKPMQKYKLIPITIVKNNFK